MRQLLGVFAAVVFVAGCGAAEDEPNLTAAIEKAEAAGSSLISIEGTAVEDSETIEFACTGKADYDRERTQIACQGTDDYEMIGIGTTSYVRGDFFGFGGAGSKWVKFADEDALGQFSPTHLLAMLRGASEEIRRVREEEVRDVETVHYRLEVECEQQELFDCAGVTAPVDVWIGDDGLVRRIGIEEQSSSGTIEFYDFGVEVVVEPPPGGQVVDLRGASVGTCGRDFGRPIDASRAAAVLRGHGFSISTDTDCAGSFAALGNTDAGMEAWEREGQLHCFVYRSSPSGAPVSVRRRGADGADAELALHNVVCTILADSPTGEEKVDRLEAAFAALEHTVRP
jgi:hypothetical protein